jgi:hypothetical protein
MRAPAAPVKDEAFRRLRGGTESCFTTSFYEIGKKIRLCERAKQVALQNKVKVLFP